MKLTSKKWTHRRWIDEVVLELRLRDVTGEAIGDATAAVESHCAESGQSADEAFGDPREYARSLDFAPHQVSRTSHAEWARVLFPVACGLIGMTITLNGVRGLKDGSDAAFTWGDLASLVACVLFVLVTLRLAAVVLRHMLPGSLWFGGGIAVMTMLSLLFEDTAFSAPWWAAGLVGVALLAVATARLGAEDAGFADPVVDPRTGTDRYASRLPAPVGRLLSASASGIFVITTVVLGALTWFVG